MKNDNDVNLLEFSIHPAGGWIRNKRNKLAITGPQLAAKMGVTKQRISALEKAELSGAASLKTMRLAAEALGCEFVYALVPKGSIEPLKSTAPIQIYDPLTCMESPQCFEQVAQLCCSFEIRHLGLYGSAARGELQDDSDINLLAEFFADEPTSTQMEVLELEFGKLFGRRVSIVSHAILENPEKIDAIMNDLKLVYAT